MKFSKYFIFILLLKQITLFGQYPENKSFYLSGNVKGLNTGFVYLLYRGMSESVLDSCRVEDGTFQFKGYVDEPRVAYLTTISVNGPYTYDKTRSLEFFIEPGNLSIVDTQSDFRYIEIKGSASDKDRVALVKSKRLILDRIDSVSGPFEACYSDYLKETKKDRNSPLTKSLSQKLDSLDVILKVRLKNDYESLQRIDSVFIINNPSSYVAAFMLMKKVGGGPTDQFPDIKKLYDRFPQNIKESSYGKSIRTIIEFEHNIYVGAEAVDFIALDEQGDTIRLVDFQNKKFVLLDFWASWCGPCRQITPILIKINAKYKEKISLISIANHDKEADWLGAIKKDQMSWIQILDNDNARIIVPGTGSITDAYYINGFPSLILIDKNHKIFKLFGFNEKNSSPIVALDSELEKILQ
jgi:thiol-disulfide isomerase/thioredoxin